MTIDDVRPKIGGDEPLTDEEWDVLLRYARTQQARRRPAAAWFCGPVPRGDSILATIQGKPMPVICERDADGVVVAKSADLETVHRISRETWWKYKKLQADAGRNDGSD